MQERLLGKDKQQLAYAATIVLSINDKADTDISIPAAGNCALSVTIPKTAEWGDRLKVIILANATGGTFTPGAGFSGLTASTIVAAASKGAIISFVFDGAKYCEENRSVMV